MKKKTFLASLGAAIILGLGIHAKSLENEQESREQLGEIGVEVVDKKGYYKELREKGKWFGVSDSRDIILIRLFNESKRLNFLENIHNEKNHKLRMSIIQKLYDKFDAEQHTILDLFSTQYLDFISHSSKEDISGRFRELYNIILEFKKYEPQIQINKLYNFFNEHKKNLEKDVAAIDDSKSYFYKNPSQEKFEFYQEVKEYVKKLLELHQKEVIQLKRSERMHLNNFNEVTTNYIEFYNIETRKKEVWNLLQTLDINNLGDDDIIKNIPEHGKEFGSGRLVINLSKINHSLTTILVPHSLKNTLPFRLVLATALGETNYGLNKGNKFGKDDAQGNMQIKPKTYRHMMKESIPHNSERDWNMNTTVAGIKYLEWLRDISHVSISSETKVPVFDNFNSLTQKEKEIVFEIVFINSIYHSGPSGDFNNPKTLKYIRLMFSVFKYKMTFDNTIGITIGSVSYQGDMSML
jgi:hypothetical protein